ncbi:retinol dehydrogenase 13-like [Chironomus tepperi]|uniref:retinol dehydrogenase 13-like n=1 Tax=Chironomus tepperi TaxID=113505 RepID=UPI00391F81D4
MFSHIIVFLLLVLSTIFLLLKLFIRNERYNKPTRIDNKVVIITGASTGIGKACAIDLAKRGGKIYIACRDEPINEKAFEDIRRESGSNNIHFVELDLASLSSVHKFSEKFHQLENRLDILINNAAVMTPKKQFTEDGFELHMGVNYLGHFLLTNLLIDMLESSAPSRIVIISSIMHQFFSLKHKDLMSDRYFNMFKAYGMSKLAITIFSKEISRRLKGTKVTVNCCNPGEVSTNITQEFIGDTISKIYSLMTKTPMEGAQNHIKLAVDPDLESVTGKYFEDCEEKEPSLEAKDIETGKWLWEISSELVSPNGKGLKFLEAHA